MEVFDYIVVGSGITGLTAARILSLHGAKILLLEKAPTLGGSVARFQLQGVPFDVGFHFTGGFAANGSGVLDEMLSLLGVRQRIKPVYFPREACHHIVFPTEKVTFTVPCGIVELHDKLKREFPRQSAGIDRYFSRFNSVVAQTPTLKVSGFEEFPPPLLEDTLSLQQVMDECGLEPLLQAILGGFGMCYGSAPCEVSFATHARICFGLHESLARVEDGGQAFVDALVEVLQQDNVDIRTGITIEACTQIENRKARRFVLTDGSEVGATSCIFTIHPRQILATLPQEHVSKAFRDRIGDFEPSIAFFALFGKLAAQPQNPSLTAAPMTSIIPGLDMNRMMICQDSQPVDSPLVVLHGVENLASGPIDTLTALEVSFPQWTAPWDNSTLRRRPAEYYQYKNRRAQSILQRMHQCLPEFRRGLQVLDTASSLTFRDYLHSPAGAAYGIRQKIGQFNVSGRLPITNIYAAGQCALLPGIIGAMTSAFLASRSVLGKETFKQFITGQLCR